MVIRANDETVCIFLGPKLVARHRRSWNIAEDIENPAHRAAALERKPRANNEALPSSLVGLGEIGHRYFKVLAAGSKSVHRETLRLTFLVELFGESVTAGAMEEVMQTGHVGAEYVEYVLRHRKGLTPTAPPLKLGRPELDELAFREPDLSVYDALFPSTKTLDPGAVPDSKDEERS